MMDDDVGEEDDEEKPSVLSIAVVYAPYGRKNSLILPID